ncbi:MAG: cytochrome b/b6 domain-containing protein [Bacteroidota bacterium]
MKLSTLILTFIFSSIAGLDLLAQDNNQCLTCHGEHTLSMEKKGKSISLFVNAPALQKSAHGDLECVGCHEGLSGDEIPHAKKIKAVDCMSCHDSQGLTHYKESVHALKKANGSAAATCADCHSTHAIQRISEKDPHARQEFGIGVCATCHNDLKNKFMASDHGKAFKAGTKGAPACIDCHGEHGVQSALNDSSTTNHKQVAAVCLSCHLDNPDVRAKVGPSAGFVSSYEQSVHGQALKHGNDMAATCTDCHSSHEMRKGSDPLSKVAKKNIASTCGQCHGDVESQYAFSVHGKAVAAGIAASATCTDCHGEHNILSPKDDRSPVSTKNVSVQVCSPCHASVKLNEKYGLASDRFQSFADSYHGLAGRAGDIEVANCASCHGIHDIKPSTDSTSRIHAKNLVNTCGTCHPGANENFTKGSVHVIATSGEDRILYFVATSYIVLIIVTIGGMFLHNLLDFIRKSKRKLMERRGLIHHPPAENRLYLRMSLGERIQHGTLLVSFTTLVLTGFALRFPDAWWVAPVRDISPMMFDLRSLSHRIAGVLMVLVSLYHIYYVLVVPRGKQLLRDMLPGRNDLTDVYGVVKYNLGLASVKPGFKRFSYIEKAEYWALIWGTFVMAVTGFILWFDNMFIGLLTKLGWDIARTIHYYEAWLATLAIIVWHFYFVIFNPDTYPLNVAFWKGTLTEEEMHEEHPLELEELKRKEESEGETGGEG